jgi:hypothetical protein
MSKKERAILHGGYEQMNDTPWITQGRDIAQRGGEGILENYNRVNVFDEGQRTSMEKLNEDAYRRAMVDLNKGYRDGMNKYASANYNRFGSLNSTPSSYITDEFNRKYQRDMAKGKKGDKAAARRVEKQNEKTMYACGGKSKKKKN